MAIPQYHGPEPLYAHEVEPDRPTLVVTFAGGVEQRASRVGRRYRTFAVEFLVSGADRDVIDTFFSDTTTDGVTSFLWGGPRGEWHRSAVATEPATSDGAVVAFSLPTTGEKAGEYPVNGESFLFRAGVQVASVTVDTDARTLTAGTAPVTGAAMTCAYRYFRRMRLEGAYRWARDDSGLYRAQMAWQEVPS